MVFFWAMLILIGMVIADFFVPMLPSATLVTAAAGLVFGNPLLIAVLFVGAAGSSWLGEFLGYNVFRMVRGGLKRRPPRFFGRFAERTVTAAVVKAERLLRTTVVDHPYRTTLVARFLPAGRTTLAWIAAGAGRAGTPYARMAALGGVAWAVYTVTLGLVVTWIAGPGLQSLLGSVLAVLAVGGILGWAAKQWQRSRAPEPALAIAAAPGPESDGPVLDAAPGLVDGSPFPGEAVPDLPPAAPPKPGPVGDDSGPAAARLR